MRLSVLYIHTVCVLVVIPPRKVSTKTLLEQTQTLSGLLHRKGSLLLAYVQIGLAEANCTFWVIIARGKQRANFVDNQNVQAVGVDYYPGRQQTYYGSYYS